MSREFLISEKTPNRILATANWIKYPVKGRIAKDIFTNAIELAPTIDEKAVLNCLVHYRRGSTRKETGIPALAYSVASTIGSTAAKMSWDMHSPEVVYMSGYHILWATGENIKNLESRGKTDTPEYKVIKICREDLGEAVFEYVDRYLSTTEDLLEILRALIYPRHSNIKNRIPTIHKYLGLGDIDRALTILHGANP